MCFSFRPTQPPLSLTPVDQCRCCSSKSLTILKCRSLINPWTELRFSPWLQAHGGHQESLYPHHRKQDTACQMQPSLLEKVFPKVVPTSTGSSQMASLAPGWCPPKRVAHCCGSPRPVAVGPHILDFLFRELFQSGVAVVHLSHEVQVPLLSFLQVLPRLVPLTQQLLHLPAAMEGQMGRRCQPDRLP